MIVSDSGAGAVREALLVSQLLTAAASWQDGKHQQRWQQQMILHTEGQQSRGETVIYLCLSLSVFSLYLSRFYSSPHSLSWQSRSVCQCDCLPSIFPPSIHPFCWGIQHPLLPSITHWLVWHCQSTCQSLCLHLPTYLSVCHSISACMNVLGWEIYCNYLHSKIRSSGQFLAPFGGISYTHLHWPTGQGMNWLPKLT